jgi:hypothetical protein
MIKITYTITFEEPGGTAACYALPPELDNQIAEFKAMATYLGCQIDAVVNEDETVLTVDHLWPEQDTLNIFLNAANYGDFTKQYETFINSVGGTVVRTQEEI